MSTPENPSTSPEPERRDLTPSGTPQEDKAASGEEQTAEPYVSTPLQLRGKIEYLAGLALTGLVPVSRINATHGCLRTCLQYSGNSNPLEGKISDEDALRILRENPELLKVLRPLLTPEQVALIVKEAPIE